MLKDNLIVLRNMYGMSQEEIAEKIGGGGHKMAAGARIVGKSLEEAEKIIFTLCKDVLK